MTRVPVGALVLAIHLAVAGCAGSQPARTEESNVNETAGLMGVRHWSHVILHVEDMAASLDFYQRLLGFETFSDEIISGPDLDAMLGVEGAKGRIVVGLVGGQKVELLHFEGLPLGKPSEGRRGLQGFTVRVKSLDDAMAACKANGVAIGAGPTEIEGFRQFMIQDPDGVKIEVSQPPDGVEVTGPLD